jgi:hypothetical protein
MKGRSTETVSCAEAAEMLGISVADVKRKIAAGELESRVHVSSGGRRSILIVRSSIDFVLAAARKTAKDAPSPSFADRYTPEDAARVFPLLKKGTPLVDVVIALSIHPSAVMAIARAYDQLRGCVTLSAEGLRTLEREGLDAEFPIPDENALITAVSAALKERTCSVCAKRPASICRVCTTKSKAEPNANGALRVEGAASIRTA